jgi:hypothetical protein
MGQDLNRETNAKVIGNLKIEVLMFLPRKDLLKILSREINQQKRVEIMMNFLVNNKCTM